MNRLNTMTNDDIEIRVEKRTDGIDRRYMAGLLTTEEYNVQMEALDQWANIEYNKINAPDSFIQSETYRREYK